MSSGKQTSLRSEADLSSNKSTNGKPEQMTNQHMKEPWGECKKAWKAWLKGKSKGKGKECKEALKAWFKGKGKAKTAKAKAAKAKAKAKAKERASASDLPGTPS